MKNNLDVYAELGSPESSEYFDNLELEYEGLSVYVTGDLEVRTKDFKIPYDGNLISGGYTETEVVSVRVYIDDVFIFDKEDNEVEDEDLKEKIIKEIEKTVNY